MTNAGRADRQPRASGGTDAQLRLAEVADTPLDLPDDDPLPERRGLYRRALELASPGPAFPSANLGVEVNYVGLAPRRPRTFLSVPFSIPTR